MLIDLPWKVMHVGDPSVHKQAGYPGFHSVVLLAYTQELETG